MQWNAESLYNTFMKCIHDDLIPSRSIAAYFGMQNVDEDTVDRLDSTVFGVWAGMWKYQLLTKDALKEAIRGNILEQFFGEGLRRLAGVGHGYSLQLNTLVQNATYGKLHPISPVTFETLPSLGAEPPRDIIGDMKLSLSEAIDTTTMPQFQTEETCRRAWKKLDDLIELVMEAPRVIETFTALEEVLNEYREVREVYGVNRNPPPGLQPYVCELKRSMAKLLLSSLYGKSL